MSHRKSVSEHCSDTPLLSSSPMLLRAAMLAAVTLAAPAMAQLVIESDIEASIDAGIDSGAIAVPLSTRGNSKMSVKEETTLGAQVDKATSAVVKSGAAGKAAVERESKNLNVMQTGAEAETYSEAVSRERMEANAEAKARTKLNARGVDAQGKPEPRTQLEKQLRADRNVNRANVEQSAAKGASTGAASASAAARANASSRSSAIGEATINQPVVGTYEAIDTDSAIETDARNGGQQLSKEARSGVQLILPGTGVNSGDKKAARAESAVDAKASNRFLIKQERTMSPETYAAVDDVFAKVDADGDNELSPEERINASNKVQLSAIYKLADTNRDGMVSRAELMVAMEANAGR